MTAPINPADPLAQVLTNLANDRRGRIRYYGNVDGLPGNDGVPRRLLSDYSFLEQAQFNYVVPSPANVVVGVDRRACTLIQLVPYGLAADQARLTSSQAADRRVATTTTADSRGVAPYPTDFTLLVSAALDEATVSVAKTASLVRRITSPTNGASFHFVIARTGDILVGAALDDQVVAEGALAGTGILVALEGALAIRATDWEAREFGSLIEVPYTEAQLTTLAILLAKLGAAYPAIPHTLVTSPTAGSTGLTYTFPALPGVQALNFTQNGWKSLDSPFDHTASDVPAIYTQAARFGPFDLATQVFRPLAAPVPQATRAAARLAIGSVDTAGAQSVYLGAYADCAGPERSYDMQQAPRRQLFISRIQRAHQEADQAGTASGAVSQAGTVLAPNTEATVTNVSPHTYDFETGKWGDGLPY